MITFSLQYFAWLEFVIFFRFKTIKVDRKRIDLPKCSSYYTLALFSKNG